MTAGGRINLIATIETFSKLQFSGFKNFVIRSVFFQTSCCNLKSRGLGAKLCVAFLFNFERNYDVLKSKSSCILLNTNIFVKNETESKMENSTHSFKEVNLVLQFIEESQIRSKAVMSLSSWKKKEGIFCTVYFVWRKFF